MELTLLFFVVLGFASYRMTRFLVIDSLIDTLRHKVHVFLVNRTGRFRYVFHKLFELLSCTFCLGWWVSLAAYSLFIWQNPSDFNQIDWIYVFAVAGFQSLLHAFEPNDE